MNIPLLQVFILNYIGVFLSIQISYLSVCSLYKPVIDLILNEMQCHLIISQVYDFSVRWKSMDEYYKMRRVDRDCITKTLSHQIHKVVV